MEDMLLLKKSMSKKAYKTRMKAARSTVAMDMNTGTRTMKSAKYPNRQKRKIDTNREIKNNNL